VAALSHDPEVHGPAPPGAGDYRPAGHGLDHVHAEEEASAPVITDMIIEWLVHVLIAGLIVIEVVALVATYLRDR
jgi:hypothetical protein